MSDQITGTTAADIADSVRALRDRGVLRAGSPLPPVRELAATLGVNRNTAVAAYRQLAQAGLVVSRGRAGTVVAGLESVAQEGYAADTVLRDVGTGNPDPRLIPDPSQALATVAGRPVLYGEPVIDPGLEQWALGWMSEGLAPDAVRLAVPKAYVVLTPGHDPSEETARSILEYARAHLQPWQRVRRLEFAELPKTISGKIRRVELRAREEDLASGDGAPEGTEWRDDMFPDLKA
jgi:hypothetical protein